MRRARPALQTDPSDARLPFSPRRRAQAGAGARAGSGKSSMDVFGALRSGEHPD
jgi:hypothetical protein